MLRLGDLRDLIQHVAIENVYQYVKNAAGRHHDMRSLAAAFEDSGAMGLSSSRIGNIDAIDSLGKPVRATGTSIERRLKAERI